MVAGAGIVRIGKGGRLEYHVDLFYKRFRVAQEEIVGVAVYCKFSDAPRLGLRTIVESVNLQGPFQKHYAPLRNRSYWA